MFENGIGGPEKAVKSGTIFIEFKNGRLIEKRDFEPIYRKLFDSILLLHHLTKCSFEDVRASVEFVIVYNEEKNDEPGKWQKPRKSSKGITSIAPNQVIRSTFQKEIGRRMPQPPVRQFVEGDLDKYRGFLVKNIHAFTVKEFEEKLAILKT